MQTDTADQRRAAPRGRFPFTAPRPAARVAASPVLRVQQEGAQAEIIIDSGQTLRSGQPWRTYAKVRCDSVFTARLVADHLRARLEEAVAAARREAYAQGQADARAGRPPQRAFSGAL